MITLCDRVREVCPEFPSHPDLVHWSVPDPALDGPDERATVAAFEHVRQPELETRIRFLLRLAGRSIDKEVSPCLTMRLVNVRYMVDDVDESVAFYTEPARLRAADERRRRRSPT